jgi:hypothetical protein
LISQSRGLGDVYKRQIKDANRGTAGTLVLQSIDGGLFVSSASVSQSSADTDAVGTLDVIRDVRTFVRSSRDGFDDYPVPTDRDYLTLFKFASDYDRTTSYVVAGSGATSGTRYFGDNENIAINFNLTAKRSVAGSVLIKTIDSTVSEGQSSVSVSYGSWQPDVTGAYDLIALLYAVTRSFPETITIGSDAGFRYQSSENTSETVRFTITKRFDETTSAGQGVNIGPLMLDNFSFNDGLTYNSTIFKRDASTIGNSTNGRTGILIAETQLENLKFDFNKFASDFNRTTSFVRIGGAETAPQRYYGAVENVRLLTQLTANNYDRSPELVVIGSDTGFRYQSSENTSETVRFTVLKTAKEENGTTSNVVMGFGTNGPGRRVSNSLIEQTNFDFILTAKRGTTGTVTIKTIDGLIGADSSVAVTQNSWGGDIVGIVDSFASQYLKLGTVFNEYLIIGNTDDGRTGAIFGQAQLEAMRFTIGKFASDFDRTTSVAWIGSGATTANNRFYGSSETVVFNFSKLVKLPNATTSNVVMGFGSGALVRVSGSLREQTNFDVSLTAKAGAVTVVSGVTVSASALGDRLFVGQQYGNIRFSADPQERIIFNLIKKADQDGAGSSLSFVTAGAGDNYGFRYQSTENTLSLIHI